MKSWIFICLMVFNCLKASVQESPLHTLYHDASSPKEDTIKVLALAKLADYFGFNQFDSSILYAQKTIALAEKINYPYGSFLGLRSLFFAYNCQANYSKALEVTLKNDEISTKIKNQWPHAWGTVQYLLGVLNQEMENYSTAISLFKTALQWNSDIHGPEGDIWPTYSRLALVYLRLKKPDSALWFAKRGYDVMPTSKRYKQYSALGSIVLGNVYMQSGKVEVAKEYFRLAGEQSKTYNNAYFLARSYYSLANALNKTGHVDSCIYYARLSLQICQHHDFSEYAVDAATVLSRAFDSQHNLDSTYKYMKVLSETRDSVYSPAKMQAFQQFVFNEEQRQREIKTKEDQYRGRIRTYALIGGIVVLLSLAFILWRNNRQKQKANFQIERAYKDLKATQAQLVQSEKMASLGELTAGIAHEIQNPLNFVNNFSDLNKELLTELRDEIQKGNLAEVSLLASDVIKNEEKINEHGRRADSIVKGMLQHSRSSAGQKELTDLNAMADEYFRLAYHGFRAKDKNFNATLKNEFDPKFPKLNVISQDFGRVLLNLINNAFYAVNEKNKENIPGYEPTVTLKTHLKISPSAEPKAILIVADNGNGIPQRIMEKIFQPFFTTKPTGQGTGLGLSLSYDIVKAHGGELRVEANEGEYTNFIIELPAK